MSLSVGRSQPKSAGKQSVAYREDAERDGHEEERRRSGPRHSCIDFLGDVWVVGEESDDYRVSDPRLPAKGGDFNVARQRVSTNLDRLALGVVVAGDDDCAGGTGSELEPQIIREVANGAVQEPLGRGGRRRWRSRWLGCVRSAGAARTIRGCAALRPWMRPARAHDARVLAPPVDVCQRWC